MPSAAQVEYSRQTLLHLPQAIPADNLPAHLRRDHGVENREMLEFYLERAKDPSWTDRA